MDPVAWLILMLVIATFIGVACLMVAAILRDTRQSAQFEREHRAIDEQRRQQIAGREQVLEEQLLNKQIAAMQAEIHEKLRGYEDQRSDWSWDPRWGKSKP